MLTVIGSVLGLVLYVPLVLVWCLLYVLTWPWRSRNAVGSPRCVLVTGASSGIGRSLAVSYAKPGVALALLGRNKNRLQEVSQICKDKGSVVHILDVDVGERELLRDSILDFDDKYPIDIIIANAGISAGTTQETDGDDQYYAIINTNILGVLNTVLPIIPRFKSRKRGQVILMGSQASNLSAFSVSHPYCASKAALSSLAASWRNELKGYKVGVSLITPGFVKTPMTDKNNFDMPLMMDVNTATQIMVDGISKDMALISYPLTVTILSWLAHCTPEDLKSTISHFFPQNK
uniref:Uncharacterized protein n=1 Tax=Arcella intermedia TaxID=1963864 RepID=A0A6B2LCB4_9EUKA